MSRLTSTHPVRAAHAFTLIELIVALAVVAALAAVGAVSFSSAAERTNGTALELSATTSAMLVQRSAASRSQPVTKALVDATLADRDPTRDGVQTQGGFEYDTVVADEATRTVTFRQGGRTVTALWGPGVADGPTLARNASDTLATNH